VQPLGMLRMVSLLSSLGEVPAEQVWAWASGNVARVRRLDAGRIAPGMSADLVLMDRPQGSDGRDVLDALGKGDLAGIGMVLTEGVQRIGRSRNTPPAERVPEVVS
jgi:enamidase